MSRANERRNLLKAANDYATLAADQLVRRLSGFPAEDREMERERLFEELQIHYLFPNLYDYERCILLALKFANRGVALMVNTDLRELSEEEWRKHESGTREIEELFVDARSQLYDSGLVGKLSPVQKEILELEFLDVAFAEDR